MAVGSPVVEHGASAQVDPARGFRVLSTDAAGGARRGRLSTAHGLVETPAFMPVGTSAAVKMLAPEDLEAVGAQIILSNAYHLYLRPGHRLIADRGGLHRFMGWDRPILTDSGGFQVYSLAALRRVTDQGVTFQSHLDGSRHELTPELAIEIQDALGSDIVMVFDECLGHPATHDASRLAHRRTLQWARRCREVRRSRPSALFGIVQGGFFPDLREEAARELTALDFDGYAIGGLSVGESKPEMLGVIDQVAPMLPADRPRYVMGIGTPMDLLDGVARGIDLFDCVMPTRHARTGWLSTHEGRVVIKHARYATDDRPIDAACGCSTCRRFSRAYLRHLFMSKEALGARLGTIHNLWFYLKFMEDLRAALDEGRFAAFRRGIAAQEGEVSE